MSKLWDQFEEVADISRKAFAAGDIVTGIAAVKLAAQLVQIGRLLNTPSRETVVKPLSDVSDSGVKSNG